MGNRIRKICGIGLVLAFALTPGLARKPGKIGKTEGLTLHAEHLRRDPLLVVGIYEQDLGARFDALVEMFRKVVPDTGDGSFEDGLAKLDEKLGFSFRNDVLAHVGHELLIELDLPPIDMAGMLMQTGGPQGIAQAFEGFGVLVHLREPQAFRETLEGFLAANEVETVAGENGLTELRLPFDDPAPGSDAAPVLSLHYGFEGELMSIGFSPDWVSGALRGREAGRRLAEGEDFSRVFAQLDEHPTSLTYVNLPKLASLLRNSQLVRMAAATNEEARTMLDTVLDPEFVPSGIGSTSVEVDGLVRTTTVAPPGLSGNTAMMGIVAAIAVPNLLNAIDRGKQKRSMADIRSVATAVEMYAIDNNVYPGPTDGWVGLDAIGVALSPDYIRVVPEMDGWGTPFRYWSDGESYRLVCFGKDGEPDRDWSGELEQATTSLFTADIVFADGQFWTWPEGQQN